MSAFSRRNHHHSDVQSVDIPTQSRQWIPTLGRRFLAWSLEIAIVTTSIATPLYLGGKLNERVQEPQADLTPVLKVAQNTTARILGLSPRSLPTRVHPLTNVVWSVSLGLPLVLAVAHLYSMSRYGRSWPKQWLGVQVLAVDGKMPGWRRSLLREGIGKWGGPVVVAYGIWQVSGGFPGLVILGGLSLLALIGENLTGLGNYPRRSWHDWLAGTCVVDQETGAIIRLSNLWAEDIPTSPMADSESQALAWAAPHGGLTSVVLDPAESGWSGSRIQPSSLGLGLGVLLILGGLAGIGSYHLFVDPAPADHREAALYTNLVSTLTDPELDASARRAAVLALGNLPDERVAPLLVDLIAQTEDPEWLDALQQALVTRGIDAVPHLRRLNQSLAADLAMPNGAVRRRTLTTRLQTVNRILAKLILLETGDHPQSLDLSHLHLGHLSGNKSEYTLTLPNQNLAGIQWQGSILNRAQFQGATFFSAGNDNHPDTYDDRTADLSGADLTHANLTGTNLFLSRMVGSSLLHTTLNRANLALADLSRANLENATLIQANLSHSNLVEARLSEADLTEAQLTGANLESARLLEVNAAGAQMVGTSLRGVTAKSATLTDANLSGALLENADLTGADLKGANLSGANLSYANLSDTDLRDVWLQEVNLDGVNLAGAIFTEPVEASTQEFVTAVPESLARAKLAGVDFSRARNMASEQLAFVCSQGAIHPTCDLPEQE